jgi:hypothetical protein
VANCLKEHRTHRAHRTHETGHKISVRHEAQSQQWKKNNKEEDRDIGSRTTIARLHTFIQRCLLKQWNTTGAWLEGGKGDVDRVTVASAMFRSAVSLSATDKMQWVMDLTTAMAFVFLLVFSFFRSLSCAWSFPSHVLLQTIGYLSCVSSFNFICEIRIHQGFDRDKAL